MRLIAVVCVVLASGCYAEITAGGYGVSQSGGAIPNGEELEGTAYTVGLSFGLMFDFWQKTRITTGLGGNAAFLKGADGSTAGVIAGPISVRLDQTLMRVGGKGTLGLSVAGAKGAGSASFTPMGGTKVEGMDTSSLDLYGGATLGLYDNGDATLTKWCVHLSGGVNYISSSSDVLGDVTLLGVQSRLTVSYGCGLVAGLALVGKYAGSGGGGGEDITSFKVDMPGSDNVIGGLGRAMQATGCDIRVSESDAIGGICNGVTIAIVQNGPQLDVACKGVSNATCRSTFDTIINNAR